MKGYKICPSCREKNPVDEMMCINCMADISNIPIVDEELSKINETPEDSSKIETSQEASNTDMTVVEVPKITLRGKNFIIEVFSGDIVGRHEKGKEYIGEYKTVSRKHAKFFKQAGSWYVEDLGSTNGVYVNGRRINSPEVIKKGDRIFLSSMLELVVEELQ